MHTRLNMVVRVARDTMTGHDNDDVETDENRLHRYRAGGRTPRTPRPEGGSRMLRGLMLCMKKNSSFFNVFKIIVNIFHHQLSHHRITTSGIAHTNYNCQKTPHI